MARRSNGAQPLSLEGEVVEILERGGRRVAKVMLKPRTVLDVAAATIREVHLGDRVVISGAITIERVKTE